MTALGYQFFTHSPSQPVKEETDTRTNEATQTTHPAAAQVEIPYVPPSHRQIVVPTIEDSIVIVGQRLKKRKRVKTQDVSRDRSGSADTAQEEKVAGSAKKVKRKTKAEETGGVGEEPFDFSAVPNILDDRPQEPESRQRKKKQKQNKGTFWLLCIITYDLMLATQVMY
jgi:exosome complex exonuclease RRP6